MPKLRFLALALLTLAALALFRQAQAAVDLADFSAHPQGETAILVEWETATEFNNAGFLLARATDPNAAYEDYTNISPFIPAEGSDVIGATYEFLDEDVSPGVVYYYLLQAIDTGQNIEYHGPISATLSIGGEPTDTPTPTAAGGSSPTPTRTRTPTQTRTPGKSPTPSNTARAATATRTRIPSHTRTPAQTVASSPLTPAVSATSATTPTATLIPPPAIVLTLPPTDTPRQPPPTATPAPSATPQSTGLFARLTNSGSALPIGILCLIVPLWAVIAGGLFVIISRKLQS